MTKKPIYEELEQRVKELEKEAAELRQAEQGLARLASFPKQNPNPVIETDLDGQVTYLNPVARKCFPYIQSASSQHPMLKDIGTIISTLRESKKESFIREITIGDSVYEQRIVCLPESKAVQILAHDLTERKQAEEQIKQQTEFLNLVLESLTHPFYVIDGTDYTIKIANSAAHLGPLSDNITCYALTHQRDTPCGSAEHLCPVDEIKRTKQPVSLEHLHYDKDGNLRNVEIHAYPIFDSEGNVSQIIEYTLDITKRKRAEEELKKSREQLRNLSAYLQSSREQERASIAREIHDDLGQTLTALKMDLSWLEKRLPTDKKLLIDKSKSMSKIIDTTIQTVRRIITDLRPGILDDLGLEAAIEWQAEDFQTRTGIKCHITIDPEINILDQEYSTAIFRILQETLTNVARHSQARNVYISMREEGGEVVLEVRDNGKGITERQSSHPKSFGLMGIRERAHVLGGKATINGIPGKGTTVTVRIPLSKE